MLSYLRRSLAQQHDILERKNLRQYFDFILLSSEFGTEKPDPDIFRHALKLHTPVEPENAIHIGDHDIKDYVGASVRYWG
jgi:putative hydrolase of the HAD superfamily